MNTTTETIILFDEDTLELSLYPVEDFYGRFPFITKKEDPTPRSLLRIKESVELYKSREINFSGPVFEMAFKKYALKPSALQFFETTFKKHILKFPTLHTFEDEWGNDHAPRRACYDDMLKSNEFDHDLLARNKFRKRNILNVLFFADEIARDEKVEKLRNEIKKWADAATSDGLNKFQSFQFAEKRLYVDLVEQLSFALIELILDPVRV